jgi:hypothetical protein|tara:strand:- start:192 stop:1019 length:828 start_codon:yes stop_codon:yes gene_type:complete
MELINLKKQNKALVERVKNALPAIDRHTRIFDRKNSQTTIQLMTLTMLGGHSPLRMLRQVTAEVEKRKNALYDAQHNVAKKQEEIDVLEEKQNLTSVEKAELIKLKHDVNQINNKANGSLKDIATLADAYDNIMSNNRIKDWNEEDFENEEKGHHVRRGFEMLYRNLVEYSRAKEATLEYLQQYGVHAQMAITEVSGYITHASNLIKEKRILDATHLENFLDEMKDKYVNNADKISNRLFGRDGIINKAYMEKMDKRNKDEAARKSNGKGGVNDS